MNKIYYIGGSPCSGKSTIAEMIAKDFNFSYFKVDDYLEDYISRGKALHKPYCMKFAKLSPDEVWLRDPVIQNKEELELYREMFEFILEDLGKIKSQNGIITEGAALLPELIKEIDVNNHSYICIVPTKEFQCHHYKLRPWVPDALAGCSDKEKAFENWMERDALFALTVKEKAEELSYKTIVNDGTSSIDDIYRQVKEWFQLSSK